jgi:hypothetical protein
MVRRFRYSLKLDVRHFFASLHHEVVNETLERMLKDRRVLRLCRRILEGPTGVAPVTTGTSSADPRGCETEAARGVGLPISNLTSQWFANLVLDRLDHQIKELWWVPGYARYMDDFVLFADDPGFLRHAYDRRQRPLGEPQQERADDPEQQPRRPPRRQGVLPPDRRDHCPVPDRLAVHEIPRIRFPGRPRPDEPLWRSRGS